MTDGQPVTKVLATLLVMPCSVPSHSCSLSASKPVQIPICAVNLTLILWVRLPDVAVTSAFTSAVDEDERRVTVQDDWDVVVVQEAGVSVPAVVVKAIVPARFRLFPKASLNVARIVEVDVPSAGIDNRVASRSIDDGSVGVVPVPVNLTLILWVRLPDVAVTS
ncbi:MAG: hypothetical protein QMD85_03305, partial [Candidatus Aenigmarchaeota archaeon]|nr:hypothetical protein [Candidatus Aenigmarchaeota archaeon]